MENTGKKTGKILGRLFWAAVLGAELTVASDLLLGYCGHPVSLGIFVVLWLVLTVALVALRGFSWKKQAVTSVVLPVVGVVALVLGYAGWRWASGELVYAQVDDGKQALYADRRVMVIVPHEDDDLNIAGGVLEEYANYGSEVYMVFVTNGDAYGKGFVRIDEALECCAQMGIPEECVIFLGYGDQWSEDGPHLYNAEPGEHRTSLGGFSQTYGTEEHPAYRDGRDYTVDNLLEDMEDVILEYRPDTILCSDYDAHIDHRAVTLAFEKVMGRILQKEPDYTPVVFKAYAYSTAWMAEPDFYEQLNLGATDNPFAEPHNQFPAVYRWEERLRLPVAAQTLSRSLMTTGNYRGMSIYASQNEKARAQRMTNSDKLFWQRRTDSLLYDGEITTSSGNGALLVDFMLLECHDLVGGHAPYDGVWVPDGEDETPVAQVTLPEKRDISQILLYDHPSPSQNVLDALVTFDDGTQLHTGPLDSNGAATVIPVDKTGVSGFTVTLCQWEGEGAGLTEIEAYADCAQGQERFIKLVDEEENFVYDYWVDSDQPQSFGVYGWNVTEADFTLTCQGEGCEASWEDGKVIVTCPRGKSCVLRLESEDGTISDSVCIRNPGWLTRLGVKSLRTMEERVYSRIRSTITLRVLFWAKRTLL